MKKLFMAGLCLLWAVSVHAEMKHKNIEYLDNGTELEGYLVYDDAIEGSRPGVIVVHDWMGFGAYGKKRAEMLAELGYVALAVDIYGKDVRPQNRQEASEQSGKFKSNRALLRRRGQTGLQTLKAFPLVDAERTAAIGYCFGGTAVLELARSGADLQGVVSFHGGLDTPDPEDAKNIKSEVLVLHGADDPHVPPEEVQAFQEEMRQAGVAWQMNSYSGAVHSFTKRSSGNDNSTGAAYNERADRLSWQDMKQFFNNIFKKGQDHE